MVNILFVKNHAIVSRSASNDARNCHQICTLFGLKQILKSPTSIICRIDHILASIPRRISQHSVINMLVYLSIKLSTVKEKLIKPKQG